MTLTEFKKQQDKALKDFNRLVKSDPERARAVAFHRLHSAGIITKDGKLAKRYS